MQTDQYRFVLNKININSIITNSGVFIGNNQASGWTLQTKVNNGFGGGGGTIIGNTNIVIDNDVIDAPVDDRDLIITNQSQTNKEQTDSQITLIHFNEVNVNALNRNCSIAIGENDQTNWTSHNKNNYGNGILSGKNLAGRNLNIIRDDDVIDAPIASHGTTSTIENAMPYSREDS